jgi:hypothetical protein
MAFLPFLKWSSRDEPTDDVVYLNTDLIVRFQIAYTEPPYATKIEYLTGSGTAEVTVKGAPIDIANAAKK